ncbi:hypothetical protein MaudCBS49596_005214 [Microsporum audouinii]
MAVSLEILGLDVLDLVCECLNTRSLRAFALVSKLCYAATMRHRFNSIELTVKSRETLRRDLERWHDILAVGGRSSYVRRLKVMGCAPTEQSEAQTNSLRGEDELDPYYGYDFDPRTTLTPFYAGSPCLTEEQNEAMLPLARFIQGLSGLRDLIYASIDQIPPCILSIVHQYRPNCRLHMDTFSLRSLYQFKSNLHDISLDEYALATSPCLYSIAAQYYHYDSEGRVAYNKDAILQMVIGLAPNLKHVRMWHHYPGDSLNLRSAISTPRPAWPGFFLNQPNNISASIKHSIGCLQSLTLGAGLVSSSELIMWSNCTEFSKLQELRLQDCSSAEELQTLTQMAREGRFNCLHTLDLVVSVTDGDDDIDEATSIYLQSLPPLENLGLNGDIGASTFNTLLHRHGNALFKLRFIPNRGEADTFFISCHRMQELRQQCPNLKEVELLIPRTRGDSHEVDIYRALGSMARLEQACLVLDCSSLAFKRNNLSDINDLDDGQMIYLDNGITISSKDFRIVLINTAFDSSLALSIFRTIHSTKGSLFQYLKLVPMGGGEFGQRNDYMDLEDIICWFGRHWICEIGQKDDYTEDIMLTEMGEAQRIQRGEDLSWEMERDDKQTRFYKHVWRSLWPDAEGIDDWSSFPLQRN